MYIPTDSARNTVPKPIKVDAINEIINSLAILDDDLEVTSTVKNQAYDMTK